MPKRARVLVTDDDPDVLLMTALLLEDEGFRVSGATTGKECLDSVQSFQPDIVLLDVMLPDMSGVEVCRRIKAEGEATRPLVMLVSGTMTSPDSQADGLDGGADGYITKPITKRELLARLHSMARIKRAEDELLKKKIEQENLVRQLKEALAEVKTLKGLIPICAWCKKIRDDEGYWERLEAYITKHTDAVFTHGMCPTCYEKNKEEIAEVESVQT